MAATVDDGSLQFTAAIDDSQLTQSVSRIHVQLANIVKDAENIGTTFTESSTVQQQALAKTNQSVLELQSVLDALSKKGADALNPENANQFSSAIVGAFNEISQMLEQVGNSFGTDKIANLDRQLQSIGDEAQQLDVLFKFLKDNIADLNLNPEQAQAFVSQLDLLQQSLTKITEVTSSDLSTQLSEPFDISKATVQQLEEELDRLIQKEQMLQRALSNTTDVSNIEGYNNELKETDSQITAIASKLDELNVDKFLPEVENTAKSGANLLTQLRELRYQIAGAIQEYGEGSPQVIGLTKQAAQLEQRLKNAQKQISLFASNTAGLDALKQGFNGIVGGMTAMISAAALLSGDNKALQETVMKLFAVMQLVNGAEQLFVVINKNSATSQYLAALAMKTNTAAKVENTVATNVNTASKEANIAATDANAVSQAGAAAATTGASAATGGLSAALGALMTPLGMVALAIGVLVAVYELFKLKQSNAEDAFANENLRLQNQFKQNATLVTDIKNKGEIAVAQLEAAGKSQAEIREAQYQQLSQLLGLAINDYDSALGEFTKQLEALKAKYGNQDFINMAPKGFFGKLFSENKGEGLTGKVSYAFGQLFSGPSQKEIQNLKDAHKAMTDQKQKSDEASKALAVKTAQDQKATTQEGLRDATDAIAARLAKAKEAGNEEQAFELQKQLNISQANAQAWGQDAATRNRLYAEASDKNKEIDVQLAQWRISNETAVQNTLLSQSKQGSVEEYNAKSQLIALNAQKEIAAAKNNQTQINAIRADAARKQSDLDAQTDLASINRQKESQTNLIQAQLDAVQKGSQDELDLKLQLNQAKENADLAAARIAISQGTQTQDALVRIEADALAERKKLEDDYYENYFNRQASFINQQANQRALPFQTALNNPLLTPVQKDQANIGLTQVQIDATQKEYALRITEWTSAVTRGSEEAEKYKQKVDALKLALDALNGTLGNNQKQLQLDTATEISQRFQILSQSFSQIAQAAQSFNPDLAEIANTFAGLSASGNDLYLIFSKTATSMEKFQAGANAAVSIIGMVINAASQMNQAEQQYNDALIQQQDAYNQSLYQSILLNTQLKDNLFTTDFIGEINDGVKSLSLANENYTKAINDLANAKIKIGNKSVVDWSNVATGAAAGAVLGSVIPGLGTAVGAIVGGAGAVVGGVIGAIFGKKDKSIMAPLLAVPGIMDKLFDSSKTGIDALNEDYAKTLVNGTLLDAKGKELVNTLIEAADAAKAANQQISDAVKSLAGDLGNNLSNALVQAFEDGTDAGKAFAQSVSASLQTVLQQLLFNAIFEKPLKDLQDKLTTALENGGNVTDVYSDFFKTYGGLSKQFSDNLQQLKDQAASQGLDIFSNSSNQNQNTLSGAIQAGITEDTATLLAGQFNAMRLEAIMQTDLQKQISGGIIKQIDIMMQNLTYVVKIENNTGLTALYAQNLVDIKGSLKSIDSKMSDFDAVKKANGIH